MDSNIGLYKKSCLTRLLMPTHVCLLYEAMWVRHMTIKLAGQFDFWVEIFITC